LPVFMKFFVCLSLALHVLSYLRLVAVLAHRTRKIPIRPKFPAPQPLLHLRAPLKHLPSRDIPRSSDNPEFRWVYDTEIVRDLIAPLTPVRWHVLAQKSQHRDTEILERCVALIMGGVSVHQSP